MKFNQCLLQNAIVLQTSRTLQTLLNSEYPSPQLNNIHVKEGFKAFSQWILQPEESQKQVDHQFRFRMHQFSLCSLGATTAVQRSNQNQVDGFMHARKHLPEVAIHTENSILTQFPQAQPTALLHNLPRISKDKKVSKGKSWNLQKGNSSMLILLIPIQ